MLSKGKEKNCFGWFVFIVFSLYASTVHFMDTRSCWCWKAAEPYVGICSWAAEYEDCADLRRPTAISPSPVNQHQADKCLRGDTENEREGRGTLRKSMLDQTFKFWIMTEKNLLLTTVLRGFQQSV